MINDVVRIDPAEILSAYDFFYVLQNYHKDIIIPSELTSQHVFSGEFGDSRIVVNQSGFNCDLMFHHQLSPIIAQTCFVHQYAAISTWLNHSGLTPSRRQSPQRSTAA